MRAKPIVVIDEDRQGPREMLGVGDQQPVQTFGPDRPNEPLRDAIRLWGLNRRAPKTRALRLKDGVETAGEFRVVVTNQKPNRLGPVTARPRDVARLLRDPRRVRVGGAAGHVDTATPELDEEQDVQALKPNGVDRKEIDGQDAVRLRAQEFLPRRTLPRTARTEPLLSKDSAQTISIW